MDCVCLSLHLTILTHVILSRSEESPGKADAGDKSVDGVAEALRAAILRLRPQNDGDPGGWLTCQIGPFELRRLTVSCA